MEQGEDKESVDTGGVRVERQVRRWTCEWNGMTADFEAETRSKARYMAYKVLNEWWNLKDLLAIKVTVSKNLTGTVTSSA